VLAFMGAMAYAELAALRPKAGGEYVYLREAFGPLAGFLTGWTSFVAGFTGAIAASAVFLIVTLNRFIPGIANDTPLLAIPIPGTSNAVTFSTSPIEVYPNGLANNALVVTLSSNGFTKRLRMSRAGLVNAQ